MNDHTVEYRVSFRTREPSPAKTTNAEVPDNGRADTERASIQQTVRSRDRKPEPAPRRAAALRPSAAKAVRLASQLALGHLVERVIADGTVDGYADAAERFGVTRARISQIVSLTLLAPEIQEKILDLDAPTCARALREVLREPRWRRQARLLDAP